MSVFYSRNNAIPLSFFEGKYHPHPNIFCFILDYHLISRALSSKIIPVNQQPKIRKKKKAQTF
ncbi:hypothetical protein CEV08_02675 [Bartonella tribocorum]|uniref:Uncharacterized protein n=1 Tax=Bartonella tribocorum TaxID=85701 RepID=A0A2M6UWU3_9HYPH|nr:hypothetical protein CEV08_02675 [Bartonella tribocorum]